MKNENIQNEQNQTDAIGEERVEVKRLSLRVRTRLRGGALAAAPCRTISCHNC